MQKAATNAEKRQDSGQCQPPDFWRHWREAESKDERRYLACQAVNKHMEKGICCLPGIMVWLYQLKLEKKLERQWEEREAAEEARMAAAARQAASRPPDPPVSDSQGEWTPEQWADWNRSQAESQPEQTIPGALPVQDDLTRTNGSSSSS